MEAYRQALREGESCGQRRVPVMEIGQRYVEQVIPAVRKAREVEVARRRIEKEERMRTRQARRVRMLVLEGLERLEERVGQELKGIAIQMPESKEDIKVDQMFTVIQNGSQPSKVLLYPQSPTPSSTFLSLTAHTLTLQRFPEPLQHH
jgi:translation initiation factor 2 alpha subunit (eIF-2alpha)